MNESPRPNCCPVLRRRILVVQHESVLTISTLRRSSVRTGKSRLISACNGFPPPSSLLAQPCRVRLRSISAAEPLRSGARQRRCRNRRRSSEHSNYISVRRRTGFLQVAVSEVPTSATIGAPQSVLWALQIQPKDISGLIREVSLVRGLRLCSLFR